MSTPLENDIKATHRMLAKTLKPQPYYHHPEYKAFLRVAEAAHKDVRYLLKDA